MAFDIARANKRGKLFTVFAFAIAVTVALNSVRSQAAVTLLEESTITNQGLYFWYPNEAKAFHYAPNISPRGDCVVVMNGYVFFGWYKGGMTNRKLMLSRKRIGGGNWVSVEFPHQNTFIENTRFGDSHRTIAVSVSEKDGTVHLLFDHHNDPLNYIISKPQIAFAPDEVFSQLSSYEAKRGYFAEGEDVRITYPNLVENDQGDVVVHYRKGSAVGGNEMVHVYNGEKWTKAKQVTRGGGIPYVAEQDKNYAYGKAAFGNGDIYYAFSVRWAAKKDLGILNEGVYLAKTGPTMLDQWEDPKGVKHSLPIQDYSPFLIDLPATPGGTGSSSGPGIAVTDDGGIQLSYQGRTTDTQYHYTYSRKAGENQFTKHVGKAINGTPYKNKLYRAVTSASGVITISSTDVGSINDTPELVLQTPYKLGSNALRIEDGKLVVIVEDRSAGTDKQKLLSYVFDLDGGASTPPVDQTPVVNFSKSNVELDLGYSDFYLNVGALSPSVTANITAVDLLINGVLVRSETVAPYEWGHAGRTELLGLPVGEHTITAIATDNQGRQGQASLSVRVKDNVIPKPTVTFPAPSITLKEGYPELVLDIGASASRSDLSITNVTLYINDVFVRTEAVAPYIWGHAGSPNPQELLNLPVGKHVFKAVATDSSGSQNQAEMTVEVQPKSLIGDLDIDGDVDRDDVRLFSTAVRTNSITDVAYDFNKDGLVNSNDVRGIALLCTRSGCATQ